MRTLSIATLFVVCMMSAIVASARNDAVSRSLSLYRILIVNDEFKELVYPEWRTILPKKIVLETLHGSVVYRQTVVAESARDSHVLGSDAAGQADF